MDFSTVENIYKLIKLYASINMWHKNKIVKKFCKPLVGLPSSFRPSSTYSHTPAHQVNPNQCIYALRTSGTQYYQETCDESICIFQAQPRNYRFVDSSWQPLIATWLGVACPRQLSQNIQLPSQGTGSQCSRSRATRSSANLMGHIYMPEKIEFHNK